jgi:hemolysin D
VNVRKYLNDNAIGSKITYLTEAQELVVQQHDVVVQQGRLREAEAAVAELTQARLKVEAEFRRMLYEDLAKAEQRAAGLAQDVIKGGQKARQQILTAPVDRVVQQLEVHTIGGVVTPAQALAVVVSLDPNLEIEAMVSNRDIGFVVLGKKLRDQDRYLQFHPLRTAARTLLSISRDAITRDRREDKARQQPAGAERFQRAQGPGTRLCCARQSRPQ